MQNQKLTERWYGCSWIALCRGNIEIICERHCIESDDQLSGQQIHERIVQSLKEDGYSAIKINILKVWTVQPGSDFP